MYQIYKQSHQLEKLEDTPSTSSTSIFDSPLYIGLILGGALLFLLIVLMLAANYSD